MSRYENFLKMNLKMKENFNMQLIPIDRVDANLWNPNSMGEVEYDALKQDMHVHGVTGVDAILVSPFHCFFSEKTITDRFVIVDGEHRWRAAKELGWKEIRCEVQLIIEDDAKALCYRRNRERGNIDPMKEAVLFKTEIDKKRKQKDIADKYGVDQTTVSRRLSLLKLSGKTVKALASMPRGIITPSYLEPIATLDPGDQDQVVQQILASVKLGDAVNVHSVERNSNWLRKQAEDKRKLAEAVQKAKFPKCPKCGKSPGQIHYKGLPWVTCGSGEWRHEWNLETGKTLYQEERITQKNLSGETEERVSRTLRCSHTVKELHTVFAERLKELVPKLDRISSLKVSGSLEGAEFHIDLTGYGHSMAISMHHANTWTGFRAEEHDYKTGEKSAVQVNDPKEIDLIREFIDNAFQGKLGIPTRSVFTRSHNSPSSPQEKKPWAGVCCSRCYVAKSDKTKCKCRCHGTWHGMGKTGDTIRGYGHQISP